MGKINLHRLLGMVFLFRTPPNFLKWSLVTESTGLVKTAECIIKYKLTGISEFKECIASPKLQLL